jgi:hypothetical protein
MGRLLRRRARRGAEGGGSVTTFDRNEEIKSLYLSIYLNNFGENLSQDDLQTLYNESSENYKSWFNLVLGAKHSEQDVKELQEEVAAITLRGEHGGNSKHLAAYLRTVAQKGEICPAIAALLAEAIDPVDGSEARIAFVQARKRGRPRSINVRARGNSAALRVAELEKEGMPKEAAVAEVVRTFGLSTSQVYWWVSLPRGLDQIIESPEFLEEIYSYARSGMLDPADLEPGAKRPVSKPSSG